MQGIEVNYTPSTSFCLHFASVELSRRLRVKRVTLPAVCLAASLQLTQPALAALHSCYSSRAAAGMEITGVPACQSSVTACWCHWAAQLTQLAILAAAYSERLASNNLSVVSRARVVSQCSVQTSSETTWRSMNTCRTPPDVWRNGPTECRRAAAS